MFKAIENLGEDIDPTIIGGDDLPDETLFETTCDLLHDHAHIHDLQDMSTTCDELENLHASVEQFGVTKSLLSFVNKDGMLSAVIPAFVACESLDGDAAPDSKESEHVKTGILAKVKEVTAAWFKKAWDFVVNTCQKIGAFSKAVYDKTVTALHWFGGKVYDAAKAAKDTITAHPIASIIGGLTLVAGGGTLLMGMWGEALPTTAAEFTAWVARQTSKITGLFKKAPAVAPKLLTHEAGRFSTSTASGTAEVLGYTEANLEKAGGLVKQTFGSSGAVTNFAEKVKEHAGSAMDKLKSLTGEALTYGRKAITWLFSHCIRAFHTICSGAA